MGFLGGPSFSDLSQEIQQNLIQFVENANKGTFSNRWELASANMDKGKSDPLVDDYGATFMYSKFRGEGLIEFQKRTGGLSGTGGFHKKLTDVVGTDFLEELLYVPRPGATVYTAKSGSILSAAAKGESLYPAYKINCEGTQVKTIGIWLANVIGKQGGLTLVPNFRSAYKALFLGKAILRKDNSIFIEAVSLQHLAKIYPAPPPVFGIKHLDWKHASELFTANLWPKIEGDIQFIFSEIMGGTRNLVRKLRI